MSVDQDPPAAIELVDACRRFGDRPALAPLRLRVGRGERVAIMGPSGSGKTTILRLVTGLDTPTAGSVRCTANRLGVVFQEARLLPWRRALDKVAVVVREGSVAQRRRRAEAALDAVGLADDGACWPRQLSGGMRQRVALARALVVDPDLLVLDEPTASLDAETRARVHTVLREHASATDATVVVVTHDAAEATALADRVLSLAAGPDGGHVVADVTVSSDDQETTP